MSLTVETGAIVSGAESYVSASDCDTYHSNRGNTSWSSATTANKEAALRKATAYVDGRYRNRWKGCRVDALIQPLEWPRANVPYENNGERVTYQSYLPITTIPQRLKDAVCEAALRALSGELAPDIDASLVRKKIDVLEWEYRPGAVPGQQTYQIIDQLLSDYLKPMGSCDAVRG